MSKHLRFPFSTAWDAFMGPAHTQAPHISFSAFLLSKLPKGIKFSLFPFLFYMNAADP